MSLTDDQIELLTPAEMARAAALTIAGGIPGYDLMLRAGKAVAAAALERLRREEGRKVAVFCGPGNNGGDGYVAALLLRQQGFEVEVGALGDPRVLRGDAALTTVRPRAPLRSQTAALGGLGRRA